MLLLDPQALPSEAATLVLVYSAVVHYVVAWVLLLTVEYFQRLLGRRLRLRWAQVNSQHGGQLESS